MSSSSGTARRGRPASSPSAAPTFLAAPGEALRLGELCILTLSDSAAVEQVAGEVLAGAEGDGSST